MYQATSAALIRAAAYPHDLTLPAWPDLASGQPEAWLRWLREAWALPEFAAAVTPVAPQLAAQVTAALEREPPVERRFASQAHDDPRGIAILGLHGARLYGPAAERLTKRDHALLQQEVNACSWGRGWLKDVLSSGREPHAFVERPVCRITSTRRLFVTSERNIADSIIMLTERAVGPYSGKRRWALPDGTFERLVSRPFEAITVELFREHGFVTGEVTAKGAWLTQDGAIQPPAGFPRPHGQIDVLAWHPTGYLLVGDCKILQLPHSETAWVNLWKKLHEDEQGFHSKTTANTDWALKFLSATGRAAPRVAMALILDQPLHLWRQSGPVTVTDYPDLARKLADGRIPAR